MFVLSLVNLEGMNSTADPSGCDGLLVAATACEQYSLPLKRLLGHTTTCGVLLLLGRFCVL